MRQHPLPISIITYAVMTMLIYLLMSTSTVNPAEYKGFLKRVPPIPWQYNYPYRGKITMEELLPHEVHVKCGGKTPFTASGPFIIACAINDFTLSWCHLILPVNIGIYTDEEMVYIVRHELAHCNGWNKDHNN